MNSVRAAATRDWLGLATFLHACAAAHATEIDAEHILGFTQGAEISNAGDVDFEAETFSLSTTSMGGLRIDIIRTSGTPQ